MPRWFPLIGWILFTVARSSIAQQLPVRTYTPADGLPSSMINHILCDSRGYIWISTRNGLARFVGYRSVTHFLKFVVLLFS